MLVHRSITSGGSSKGRSFACGSLKGLLDPPNGLPNVRTCMRFLNSRTPTLRRISRTPGTRRRNPIVSVMNPGVTRRAPETRIMPPWVISFVGISPCANVACTCLQAPRLCRDTSAAPIKAVMITNRIVEPQPTDSETLRKSAISAIGIATNSTNRKLLVLIPVRIP
jgi:hypothetical protein